MVALSLRKAAMLAIAMSVSIVGYIPSVSQVKSRPREGTTKISSLALNANESLNYVCRPCIMGCNIVSTHLLMSETAITHRVDYLLVG